ncbi:MAG: VIT1/CCC1 transporter family protein [Saprospiraceae bacterium]|jgi:VIT1/CCC1 family predicted Fe2+/Mn2+ transporter|nr:VIT1/CCC1 transporter family protein [Saprospiraceae bacterium]MBK6476767.1 VIT1/CCC1 transporter family protein [Saprospiraceae bacterium]MBK6816209.1 VIT1/CCC1 transporter family protein [Saprospiraceae bacterium]MBK7438028.1 VIT1/CCC1 transporter family protein [Saprospiraceae bacterium]MBK8511921.1 VIT1/CCC1 transporter family protein [Saprospiraceae bacterium]
MKKFTSAENSQTEVDAAYLYYQLEKVETDPSIKKIFHEMAIIEAQHASSINHSIQADRLDLLLPSWRAKVVHRIGKVFGYEYVLDTLMQTEKSLAFKQKKLKTHFSIPISGKEDNHTTILDNLVKRQGKVSGAKLTMLEGRRHKTIGGNALRAAVLGANDGLISNASLVMGMAGATNGGQGVLLAGVAGLLAGALSMALGEWISVKSSQELYERQMQLEIDELEMHPELEQKELQLIYMSKGIEENQALELASKAFSSTSTAKEILIQEELGIQQDELEGSAWTAAIASFILFAIGAIIPVVPFMLSSGPKAIIWAIGLTSIGLFFIGSAITIFTGKSIWYSGFRQVIFGVMAAAITYGIGSLIGVTLD